MKSILFSCVNYNSYKELCDYLSSIDKAAGIVKDLCSVTVLIADNSTNQEPIDITIWYNIEVICYGLDNLGYMGGAEKAMQLYGNDKVKQFDYIIISNVDLFLSETFFVELLKVDITGVGWIAPRVYTIKTGKEENPLMLSRPSKRKLQLLSLLYTFSWIYSIYVTIIYSQRHSERDVMAQQNNVKIYAGHGSIMIFTKSLINNCLPFKFPCFLYGEEIFMAELIRTENLVTIYCPLIRVNNIANVSTSLLGIKKRCYYSKIALKKIIKLFF